MDFTFPNQEKGHPMTASTPSTAEEFAEHWCDVCSVKNLHTFPPSITYTTSTREQVAEALKKRDAQIRQQAIEETHNKIMDWLCEKRDKAQDIKILAREMLDTIIFCLEDELPCALKTEGDKTP
jgi:hypothetical protein